MELEGELEKLELEKLEIHSNVNQNEVKETKKKKKKKNKKKKPTSTLNFSEIRDPKSWIQKRDELHLRLKEQTNEIEKAFIKAQLKELATIRKNITFPPNQKEDPAFFDDWGDTNETEQEKKNKKEELRKMLKMKMSAYRFNRQRRTEENTERDEKGRVVGKQEKSVFNINNIGDKDSIDISQIANDPNMSMNSKVINIFNTISKNPEQLDSLIEKTGISKEKILEIASKYSENKHGKPIYDQIDEIKEDVLNIV